VVVAYEPVWAIGSGRTASAAQAQQALAFVRERLAELFSWSWAERVRLLYGGSASPDNAAELAAQPDVDGFLVGGAGLDPEGFGRMIARTARTVRAAQTDRAAAAGDERGTGGR
jgi:triosephosphate isomerase